MIGKKSNMKNTFFITGASSGIGKALAEHLAGPGIILGLVARRHVKLNETKIECEKKGATVYIYEMDVRRHVGMEDIAKDFIKKAKRIDVVIANAGIAYHGSPFETDAPKYTDIVHTNIIGVIHTHLPFLQQMKKQGFGQLVTISSIAGFLKLPGGTYSATKAALRYLMEGWRMDLRPFGIKVTNIFPGFVASEMTDPKKQKYPFLVKTRDAAKLISNAIYKEKTNYIFPWQMALIVPILRVFPGIIDIISSRLKKKAIVGG